MEEKKNINVNLTIKGFETAVIWLLGFNFLIGSLVFFKVLSIFKKMNGSLNKTSSFVDLVVRLVKEQIDLKALQKLMQINRVFTLITIVIIAFFILLLVIQKKQKKLTLCILLLCWTIFSIFLNFLTHDLFYALKSINERIFTEDFSKILYLLQRMQNIKDTKYIILSTFAIAMILSLISIIIYIYEMFQKEENISTSKLKLNAIFCLIVFVIFLALNFGRYKILSTANIINPFDYYILGYDIDSNNKIVPVSYVDYKKIEQKYLDPHLINFLEHGLRFDIKKEDKTIETDKNMRVDVSYNVDVADELELKMKKLTGFVKNKIKPNLLVDVKKLNKKSLINLIAKYDVKYLNRAVLKEDEICGQYYDKDRNNNIEIYLVSKVKTYSVPIKFVNQLQTDSPYVYQIIYIGNIFVDNKGQAIGYTGINNSEAVMYVPTKEIISNYINQNNLIKF